MIAVDAMGGDYAPVEVVAGSIRAAKRGIPVLLCGDELILTGVLEQLFPQWKTLPITIEPCADVITMDDEPGRAILKKEQSSLLKGLHAVSERRAQAFVSAGNSGAVVVGSSVVLGRLPGVFRPAIGTFLPTKKSSVFCLDLGANVDCKPTYLEQFALMGHLFVKQRKGISKPRVGLLSNGTEANKGTAMYKQAYAQLSGSEHINFVGNIEPHSLFDDTVDVLVCDGFNGNIILKSLQGGVSLLFDWIKAEAQQSFLQKMFLWLNKKLFTRLQRRAHYASIGGALLLGTRFPVILAHGHSKAEAIENAIVYANQLVESNTMPIFNQELSKLIEQPAGGLVYKSSVVVSPTIRSENS